jgi:hypothetical protein
VRRLDGLAAGEAGGQEARRGSSGCGGADSVPVAVLRTRARRPGMAFIAEFKAVGEFLRVRTAESRYGRWPPATCAACTAATSLGGCRGRRGLAMAHAARGARGVGEGGSECAVHCLGICHVEPVGSAIAAGQRRLRPVGQRRGRRGYSSRRRVWARTPSVSSL